MRQSWTSLLLALDGISTMRMGHSRQIRHDKAASQLRHAINSRPKFLSLKRMALDKSSSSEILAIFEASTRLLPCSTLLNSHSLAMPERMTKANASSEFSYQPIAGRPTGLTPGRRVRL